jgi:hypothetical protein
MNRKQRFAFNAARAARKTTHRTKSLAHDAVNGAGLLLGFARATVRGTKSAAKNAAADVARGARHGWKSADFDEADIDDSALDPSAHS